MTPFDTYGLDYTGYGPTGGGNAPSAHQMRMQAMNRFHTDRMSTAMQFIDPYITAAGRTAQQLVATANSPGAARRSLYSSAGGQAALDGAMMARRMGVLGQGDPVNYGTNIIQGIAGGGFTASFGGTMGGKEVFGDNQRVSGQGALAERVSMSYAKGLLGDLYGEGTPDPGKLHGFDMEEASRVFSTIARRGGVGKAAHVERNASGIMRLDSGIDSELDENVRDAMKKARGQIGDPARRAKIMREASAEDKQKYVEDPNAMDSAELKEIAKGFDDAKERGAIERIANSTDATFINKAGRQKVAKVVEKTIEGMSSLADIYGELSDTQLHQKLEELSGMRITNFSQAKRATSMVNQLRGAAEISGMDPRAFMEFASSTQASLQGDVMRVGGFDERTATQAKGITATMNTQMLTDSAVTAKMAAQDNKYLRDQGYDVGDAPTTDEIYADQREGRLLMMNEFQATTLSMGDLSYLPPEQRKAIEALKEESLAVAKNPELKGSERTQEKRRIERALQREFASAGSRPGEEITFDEYREKRSVKQRLNEAMTSADSATLINEDVMATRMNDENLNEILNYTDQTGMTKGGEDTEKFRNQLVRNVSAKRLGMLKETGENQELAKKGPEAVQDEQRKILKDAGIEGDDADEFLGRFFDESGKVKDEENFKQVVGSLAKTNWTPGQTQGERQAKAAESIDMIGKGGKGVRLRDEDGKINLNSIVTALATGKSKGFRDQESMALAVQAMGADGVAVPMLTAKDADGETIMEKDEEGNLLMFDEEGKVTTDGTGAPRAKMIDMGKETAANINFSQELNEEGMKKLESVYGGDLGLHKKLGYESKEAMYEATKGDAGTEKRNIALQTLLNDEDYNKLNMGGTADNLTAISDDALLAGKQSTDMEEYLGSQAAVEKFVNKGKLSDGEESKLMQKARKGTLTKADFGEFEAEGAKDVEDPEGLELKFWEDKDKDGHKTAKMMGGGLKKMMGLAWDAKSSSPEDLSNLVALNKKGGGALLDEAQDHLKAIKETAAKGATRIQYGDDVTKESVYTDAESAQVKALENLIAVLKDGSNAKENSMEKMTVTNLEVTGTFHQK